MDPTSFANLDKVRVTSFHLELAANFDKKVLKGHVDLSVEALHAVNTVVLDSKDLTVHGVAAVHDQKETKLEHKFGEAHEVFGTPLEVSLQHELKQGDKAVIRIHYETAPSSSALQWLEPALTAGKKHPYLFTQCQAIHCRSLMPTQDSAGVKCPYTAKMTVPAPLVALMSALQDGKGEAGPDNTITYSFKQPVPIPAYLLAIAVGALQKKDIGPRSAVWSEAEMVEAGAHEFADTEKFIKAAEEIAGPYVWGRYDILLLPPSFPYGGMENPCLTFVTPTLLAGDRSLATVVAHEIAHSWMGNLVSPKNWEHFWMNEGFTVFLERKIVQALWGKQQAHLHAITGHKALRDSVAQYGCDGKHPYTCMVVKLQGVDPDDSFSSVPYEKGFNFLFYLETVVGGEKLMNPFLKAHCEKYKFGITDSEEWKTFFLDYFKDKVDAKELATIDWETWYYKPGMPPVDNKFDTSLVDAAHKLAHQLAEDSKADLHADDVKKWSSMQVVTFLEKLEDLQLGAYAKVKDNKDELAAERKRFAALCGRMDDAYGLTASKNAEIRLRWYTLCIRADVEKIFPHVSQFLGEQGRMKFVRPLYRDLFASPLGKEVALSTFAKHRHFYHPIALKMCSKDLGLA